MGITFLTATEIVDLGVFPQPQSPVHPQLTLVSDLTNCYPNPNPNAKSSLGRLPKIDFPKFDGENPKLWQSCCEIYFKIFCRATDLSQGRHYVF
jgi:hypothetical protein